MKPREKAPAPRGVEFDPDAASPPASGIFGLPFSVAESRFVVVPAPFEATASYGGGASRAPAAILRASRQVDLHDRETGEAWSGGIAMLPIPRPIERLSREGKRLAATIIKGGGVPSSGPAARRAAWSRRCAGALKEVNKSGERLNSWVRAVTEGLLDEGKVPVVLGGDHSVPFGAIQALAARHPGLGILHLDAHADLREAYEGFVWSHASIMFNVFHRIPGVSRIVQVAVRDFGWKELRLAETSGGRICTFFDADLARRQAQGEPFTRLAAEIAAHLPERVHVSFDIDALDPSLCPHTGTPVPGGLSFQQACLILGAVVDAGRTIVGCDLAEVAPGPRGDEWDANVGARVLYKLIGYARLSRGAEPPAGS
jgi:agmatinase